MGMLGCWGVGRREEGPSLTGPEAPPTGLSQACAPMYSWRTEKEPHSDPVGTCYLSTENFTRILEYAPCRSGRRVCFLWEPHLLVPRQMLFPPNSPGSVNPLSTVRCPFSAGSLPMAAFLTTIFLTDFSWAAGQGYCQGGFSAEFTKVRG